MTTEDWAALGTWLAPILPTARYYYLRHCGHRNDEPGKGLDGEDFTDGLIIGAVWPIALFMLIIVLSVSGRRRKK